MRKPAIALSVAGLLLAVACQRPEVEAFRLRPAPIVVRMELPAGVPEPEGVRREYEAALRARLATRATVVVDGATPPADAAHLSVVVTELGPPRRDASPAAVGVATGLAIGTLGALVGNRDAVFDGMWWGLWAGAHASAARRHDARALGYRPNRIEAVVLLSRQVPGRPRDPEVFAEFEVSGREVIDAMSPLGGMDRDDPVRVREEEARALARVVVRRLEDRFGWIARTRPDWYGLRPEPEPAPQAPDR